MKIKKSHFLKLWACCLILFVGFGCKVKIITPAKLDIAPEVLDETYKNYRDIFFKVYLDEEKNRFNGCVVEKVYLDKKEYLENPFSLNPKKYKFGDGTIYAGFALSFLGFDYAYWVSQNNEVERLRTFKMIMRVFEGIENCDKISKNGSNGFLYRDTVGSVEGLEIDSDFNSPRIDDKEMSQSQIASLFVGFDLLLTVIDHEKLNSPEFVDLKKRIILQMKKIVGYLIQNKFKIQSEIYEGRSVRRGPGVSVSGWMFVQILKKWLPKEDELTYSGTSRYSWKMGASAAYSFYSLLAPEAKDYEDALKSQSVLRCRSWRANYFQSLAVALHPNMQVLNHSEPDWAPWVKRYQNGYVIAVSMAKSMYPDDSFKKILFTQLSRVPTKHLPDNIHADHQGWNLDNRWVRLMNTGEMSHTKDEVTVYNGLDFLMACSAFYYSELGYAKAKR